MLTIDKHLQLLRYVRDEPQFFKYPVYDVIDGTVTTTVTSQSVLRTTQRVFALDGVPGSEIHLHKKTFSPRIVVVKGRRTWQITSFRGMVVHTAELAMVPTKWEWKTESSLMGGGGEKVNIGDTIWLVGEHYQQVAKRKRRRVRDALIALPRPLTQHVAMYLFPIIIE